MGRLFFLGLAALALLTASFAHAADKDAKDKPEDRVYERPITVRGTVSDAAGQAVAEAKVYLLCTTYPVSRRIAVTTTDDEGYYEFKAAEMLYVRPEKNAAGGDRTSFEVLAVAPGHGFGWQSGQRSVLKIDPDELYEDVDPKTVLGEEAPVELDLELSQSSALTGSIFDEEGQPIAGVGLQLRYCARINEDAIAKGVVGSSNITELTAMNQRFDVPAEVKYRQTDKNGRFEFTDLPSDCLFRIDLRHADFASSDMWMATTDRELPNLGEKTEIHSAKCNLVFRRVYPVQIRVVYEDSDEPAPGVFVDARCDRTEVWQTSDEEGLVTLRLPVDEYKVHLLPAKGTPYLITDSGEENPLSVTNPPSGQPAIYRLRRGCELEVTIVDAETGQGIPDVDLWINRRGEDLIVRSWRQPTSHVDRPVSDNQGKLTALVKPGKQRIGAGNSRLSADYRVDNTGQEVECEAGKTVSVKFRLQRKTEK